MLPKYRIIIRCSSVGNFWFGYSARPISAMYTFRWHSLMADVRKKYRAQAGYLHYRVMIIEKLKRDSSRLPDG